MFHLANHAVFKALLFLSAGCIIHGLSDEQDLRKMGGIIKIFPVSYVMRHHAEKGSDFLYALSYAR